MTGLTLYSLRKAGVSKEMPSLYAVKSSGGSPLLGISVKQVVTYFSRVSNGSLACKQMYHVICLILNNKRIFYAYLYGQRHSVSAVMTFSEFVQLRVQFIVSHILAQRYQIAPNKLVGWMTSARKTRKQLFFPILITR